MRRVKLHTQITDRDPVLLHPVAAIIITDPLLCLAVAGETIHSLGSLGTSHNRNYQRQQQPRARRTRDTIR